MLHLELEAAEEVFPAVGEVRSTIRAFFRLNVLYSKVGADRSLAVATIFTEPAN